MKRFIYLTLLIILTATLNSCVTVPKPPAQFPEEIILQSTGPVLRHDVTHVVAPGETLWRVSRMYNVPISDLLSANKLKTQVLEKGQRLLVPNAAPITPVIPLYPSKKWKYIVIHHSATDEGSSLQFDRYHQSRGWEGLGYHFVIDNGTKGKQDGQIEVSPRWLKQQDGAHCSDGNMNERAIGICLVGNFNIETISDKQLDALVYLTGKLRRYYAIPLKRIMGHGQVYGAKTDCPGKKFPWAEFKRRLENYNNE